MLVAFSSKVIWFWISDDIIVLLNSPRTTDTHLAADKERSKWQPTAVKKNADAQCLITPHLIILEFIKSCGD